MKKKSDAERMRAALASRDVAELTWALEHARARAAGASDETLRHYWEKIIQRIEQTTDAG